MGSESIAHEAEGWMGYWLRGHDGERNNCFSKIQLVDKKYRDKKYGEGGYFWDVVGGCASGSPSLDSISE